jgi:hypothetical protein
MPCSGASSIAKRSLCGIEMRPDRVYYVRHDDRSLKEPIAMEIDLSVPGALTLDAVRRLIASKDDSKNRQLRVATSGKAFISDDIGNINLSEILFRLETWIQENGYCGVEAAQDDKWVETVFNDLAQNWPNPSSNFID